SHTLEPVDLPEQAAVDHFLPPYQATYKLDPEAPHVFNAIVDAKEFTRMRRQAQEDMVNALVVIQDIDTAFQDTLGRSYGLLETYRLEDAEVVMVAMGAACGTAKDVVDELRDQDTKVGLVRIRVFRPFPITHLRKLLSGKRKVAVLDQAVSRGSGGILSQEVKQALFHDHHFHSKDMPQVFSYIAGIGGLDITPKMLKRVFEETLRARDSQTEACWMEASA
ncbi:MAG: pyruvate ferredoxin oxidoreductase, partial [Deltaproteobacteria bacterium]|nr:pyruvate ferredoxin oxidoreductase [Deltaproteobacteria bacterium]